MLFSRQSFVLSVAFVALLHVASPAQSTPVRLEDRGVVAVLDNGIVVATIDKATASVTSLKYQGNEMVLPGKKSGNVYFSMDGGENYRQPKGCVFAIHSTTPEMVDVSCKRVWKDEPQAFDIDAHFVLRQNDPALYVYAVLHHPAAYPATTVNEWRMVWRTPAETDDWICVDELRHWPMPDPADYTSAQTTAIKEIVKLTQGVRAGKYDCKYDFNASYHEIGCWGHAFAKKKLGAFIVCGGYDYFNDGPTKRDLNAAAGINHIHFGMNHYAGSRTRVAAGEAWSKVYGPWLLYCNQGETVSDMWQDAKERTKKERVAWPYVWLAGVPQYPPAEGRGGVTGKLVVKDPAKPDLTAANAWVGLAQPAADGNWQFESKHYQYWTRADAEGRFTIPHVRPGTYTLYAFTRGVVDEFVKQEVQVTARQDTNLAELAWNVSRKGRLLWEIGIPNRTAEEFAFGKDYFRGFVWREFSKRFSNPLEFTIGKSDPAKDWNYAHCGYGEGKLQPWKWRIHFDLDTTPQQDGTLTLALASSDGGRISVYTNDEEKPVSIVNPSMDGGNALLRESILAKYCVEQVSIPAAKLRAGKNTITLVQSRIRGPGEHVMYDSVSLELP